ncbi:MAG: cyclic nucleotide-binding domain-containing protein [Ardenticatenaceae bacterium]|nr:cyclic nucleotide-binding domain-containing protein [Ardenticatenaceae bacterium]
MKLLSRLLKIRRDEWPRLLILYLMIFLTNVGTIWGAIVAESVIWKEVGLSLLPVIFVVNGLLAIPGIAIYTAFADRIDNTKLYVAILGLSVVGIGLGLVLIFVLGQDTVGYGLLYVIAFVLMTDIFGLHWFTYVNSFYDTRSAKRILPVLGTASRFGGIFAGQAIGWLNIWFPTKNGHIILWGLALIGAASLAWLMPYLLRERQLTSLQALREERAVPEKRPSHTESIREGYHYIRESTFLRWMAAATIMLTVLMPLINYQTAFVLRENLGDASAISEYIGNITSIANLIMLPVQLVLLSRLISKIGLANANLIFPSGTLLLSSFLVIGRSQLAAGLSYFNRTSFNFSFRGPIDSLLYNAVPVRIKGRARAFIGGFIIPIGSIVGGILLIIGGGLGEVTADSFFIVTYMPIIIITLALAYFYVAYRLRRPYTTALIALLEQEDYAFLFAQAASDLTVADPTAMRTLAQKLEESNSPELTLFIARLLADLGGDAAVPILGRAMQQGEPRVRAILLDVLAAADLRGDLVQQLFIEGVSDRDMAVRQSAVVGLAQLVGTDSAIYLTHAQRLITDPNIAVRVQVLPSLLRSTDRRAKAVSERVVSDMLAHDDAAQRALAVRVLGQTAELTTLTPIGRHTDDAADEVRLEVALALEALTRSGVPEKDVPMVLAQVRRLVTDAIERVRQAALVVCSRLDVPEAGGLLVKALSDGSQNVRATAVDVMVQAGDTFTSLVRSHLQSEHAEQRKMAALVLTRINPTRFFELLLPPITDNLRTIYEQIGQRQALLAYPQFPTLQLLQAVLQERNEALLAEIFYLLTAVHAAGDIEVIEQSLRSEEARVRANAIEALESITTPQTAALIGPLFEPEQTLARLAKLGRQSWEDLPKWETAALLRQWQSQGADGWLQALATFALGEIGAGEQGSRGEGEQRRGGRGEGRGERREGDLLDRLTGEKSEETEEGEKPRRSLLLRRPQLLDALLSEGAEEKPAASGEVLFARAEIEGMLTAVATSDNAELQAAAQAARRMLAGQTITEAFVADQKPISIIEKIALLKNVPFFQGITVGQLQALARVCEAHFFTKDSTIYQQGDAGGELYVVISGRVGIEQEGERKGSFKRLQTLEANGYFGEMNLFDGVPHEASAVAARDTLALRLRREPLLDLARQSPALSIALIQALSQRLREATQQAAGLSGANVSQLEKLLG